MVGEDMGHGKTQELAGKQPLPGDFRQTARDHEEGLFRELQQISVLPSCFRRFVWVSTGAWWVQWADRANNK